MSEHPGLHSGQGALAEVGAWEGMHQVCGPVRAATFIRAGKTRYRLGVPPGAGRNLRQLP